MGIIKKITADTGSDMWKGKISFTVCENVNWCCGHGNQYFKLEVYTSEKLLLGIHH